jgi:hypothetical protein
LILPENIRDKFKKIYRIPPNDLHFKPLTTAYKIFTRRLKFMPFLYLLPIAIIIAIVFQLFAGKMVIDLTSLLQNGF